MQSLTSTTNPHGYALSSDLARLSLPQEYKDANRRLAWINSICVAFLFIGVVGFKPPKVKIKPLTEVVDIVPVEITQPEEQPKQETTEAPPEQEPPPDASPETPVVATVVALNSPSISFPVQVEGPVSLVPAKHAPPPPREVRPPTTTTSSRYVPSAADWGGHTLDYPPQAWRMRYQGTVVLMITVDPSGKITSVQLKESSGYKILDEAALEHVRAHLRLRNPPGEVRYHTLDIVFRIDR